MLAKDHETPLIELSINAFLINTGKNLILVDTGAGELFGPNAAGRLVSNLRAAGYRPEQIDTVLLTHLHADHSGGLSVGGQRQFTNAVVYVDKRDPAFWLDADQEKAAPENRRRFFRQAHATVDPYVRAGRLRTFEGATLLFPGIRSIPAYGHTPGHTAYMVDSRGQRLLLWGDVIHCAEVQFRDPTITIEYDIHPTAAVAMHACGCWPMPPSKVIWWAGPTFPFPGWATSVQRTKATVGFLCLTVPASARHLEGNETAVPIRRPRYSVEL